MRKSGQKKTEQNTLSLLLPPLYAFANLLALIPDTNSIFFFDALQPTSQLF